MERRSKQTARKGVNLIHIAQRPLAADAADAAADAAAVAVDTATSADSTDKRCVALVTRLHESALKGEGDMALILNHAGDRCYAHKPMLRDAAEYFQGASNFSQANAGALHRDGEACEYTVSRRTIETGN